MQIINIIKNDSICLDRNVRIDRNTIISANTYVGKQSTIGLKSTIGESVVIYANVKLPHSANIKSNEIVILTPSSYDLFRICARQVTDDEYEFMALILHSFPFDSEELILL